MPQFAANLSMLYTEYEFLDRFDAAAQDGFKAVEFLFPYDHAVSDLASRLQASGLQQVLFNAPPAGVDAATVRNAWSRGERGTACLPGREAECRHGVALAIDYALALNCPRIHVMAGLVPQGVEHAALHATYLSNVQYAATEAAKVGLDVMIEPINTRDMPGYFLSRQDQAHAVLRTLGAANLRVQMDLYHCQIMEGDVSTKLRHYIPTGSVGHIQIAGVPDRHEPDGGELNYPYLFDVIDALGYSGWIGCEYRPRRGAAPHATRHGLSWMQRRG
jgi:hydroxypyruvate isomerase